MIDNSQWIPSSIAYAAHGSPEVFWVCVAQACQACYRLTECNCMGTDGSQLHEYYESLALQTRDWWRSSLCLHPAKGKTSRADQVVVYHHSQSDVYPQGKLDRASSLYRSLNQEGVCPFYMALFKLTSVCVIWEKLWVCVCERECLHVPGACRWPGANWLLERSDKSCRSPVQV